MNAPVIRRALSVGTAVSNRDWRSQLQRHCINHVSDVVIDLVRDGRQALQDGIDIVLLDDDTSWLSAPFVGDARDKGIVVVGLYDPAEADGHGQRHLQRLGLDTIVASDVGSEELVELLRSLRPQRDVNQAFFETVAELDDRVPTSERQVIVVGGPAGAGATEVTVGLAQLLSHADPIVVDVDETHPSIARRLGLGIHPHLVTAIEAHRKERLRLDGTEGESLEDCLAVPVLNQPAAPFEVIVGLASRDDWSLLRADDVVSLLDELSSRWATVIARVGPALEDLSRFTERFEVSRSVTRRADRLIGVCDASPTGLLHFIDWLVEAVVLVEDAPIDVVLNRAPPSPAARTQLLDQITEITGDRLGQIIWCPRDKRVERAAWDATAISKGPFLRHLAELTGPRPSRLAWRRKEVAA